MPPSIEIDGTTIMRQAHMTADTFLIEMADR